MNGLVLSQAADKKNKILSYTVLAKHATYPMDFQADIQEIHKNFPCSSPTPQGVNARSRGIRCDTSSGSKVMIL